MSDVPSVDIVEDDESARSTLGQLCEAAGYRVRSSSSAEEYLLLRPADRPCCVIVDLWLPGMNGADLLDHLRKSSRLLPSIVLSGSVDMAVTVRCMQLGAVTVLEKPVCADGLISAIETALDVSRDLLSLQDLADCLESLTERERFVLDLLMDGESYKAVSSRLDMSLRTVERIRERLLRKTNYQSIPPLIRDIGVLKGVTYRTVRADQFS